MLTENRHSPGCLPSLHLLPVMKTEGAACSDSGYRSVKHGQNTARGTQGVGGWWGEGKGDTMQLERPLAPSTVLRHLPMGRGRKLTNQRERQVCRGKGEEMRDMGQDEVLDGKSCI